MQASPEVRHKLVLVIGNLICRCIEEARHIPYVLGQEQVMEILVGNPAFFAELVREEGRDDVSHDRLSAKMDALRELGQLEGLSAFDVSFRSSLEAEADLEPVLNLIHRLTRTFMVYTGNTVTIFEKEFQLFIEKLRQSLLQVGTTLKTTELTWADLTILERRAEEYLDESEFLQAFSFERMLNAEIITKEMVKLPSQGESLSRKLIRSGLGKEALRGPLVRFLLRASYVSQGNWQDLFDTLVTLTGCDPMLVDAIENDGVFCCNLLGESFANLKRLPSSERRKAIEAKLELAGKRTSSPQRR